jgi:hypothetical protein
MFAHHGRTVLFAALLTTAVSAPALANDTVTTAQQISVGQAVTGVAAQQTSSPVVVQESFATVTNGNTAAPRARAKVPDARPTVSEVRQPSRSASYHRPSYSLILGIGY